MNKLRLEGRFARLKPARLLPFVVAMFACWLYPAGLVAAATLSYVQGNSAVPQTSQTTVNVTFTAAQAAGDLNVVVVGWNDTTATVSSVADKSGNAYTLAVGPTAFTGVLSQSIYYAKNIKSAAAAANIVTVTFSPAAAYPDIRILEYNGADLNSPVDVTAANTGNSSTTNSGSATTTNATDLLLGASMVATFTTGPGTGFTSRLLTSPDGDIAEDRMVTATGSYSATTAALSPAGPWVMQIVAFRTPLGSVAPPTAPGNLTATAASTTQIDLSWTASTSTIGIANYVVQRCQGAGCTNFASVATPIGTTYNDTGLTANTSYSYRVEAVDTLGTPSTFSNTASATTPANAPTAPTNLTAAAAGPVQINLSWTASTETGGTISQYLIERCTGATCSNFLQVGTSTTATFNDTGLLASTTYSYRVRAMDSTNTTGPYSNTASATTAAPTFTAPSGLVATASGPAQINLSWTAATETGGTITQYLIERCAGATCSNFLQVGTSPTTTFNDTGLLGSTTYSYRVRATDASNNFSAYSNTASATTAAPTFTAPSNLTAIAASSTQINLSWTAATETGGTITQYLIERCQGSGCSSFAQVATSTTSTFNDTGLLAGTTYSYRVRATDAASNLSPYSNVASATTLSTNATLSYVQGNSAVPQTSQTTVNVTFTAAQAAGDLNVVVVGWNDTTATVSSVADKSGNTYTLAVGPTAFTGVLSQSIYYAKNIKSAAAAANIVTVTFSPAAAYPDIRILEYNGADLNSPVDVTAANTGNSSSTTSGSATTTNATDLLLGASMVATFTTGPGTGFTSRLLTSPDGDIAEDRMVTATGSYSATTAALSPAGPWVMQMVAFRTPTGTGDTTPPTAPSNLTTTVIGSQINLSWTASTDNVGVTGYRVERCQGAGCTTFAQIATPTATTYSDTGLVLGSYSYRVRATDA